MKKVLLIFLSFLMISFFVGCATQEPLYYWGNYSQSLYNYKKLPKEENLTAHKACLVKIINESNKRNKKTPPGVCCEYGYILLREGKTQEALYYFEMEERNYPESKLFITRLKEFMTQNKERKPEKEEIQEREQRQEREERQGKEEK